MFRTPPMEWFSQAPNPTDASWRLRYHGTAGFTISGGQTNIVLDPFVSRPSLLETGLKRLVPNKPLIEEVFPQADAVLVGHAHHDHHCTPSKYWKHACCFLARNASSFVKQGHHSLG